MTLEESQLESFNYYNSFESNCYSNNMYNGVFHLTSPPSNHNCNFFAKNVNSLKITLFFFKLKKKKKKNFFFFKIFFLKIIKSQQKKFN